MTPVPFWQSKNFYATLLALLVLGAKLAHVLPADWDTVAIISTVLAFLGTIFRWNADAPLTAHGPDEAGRMALAPTRKRGLFADRIGG